MPMEINAQKEQFSRAFAGAVISAAGFKHCPGPDPDDDSVDLTMSETGTVGSLWSPKIDVQLKCTASLDPVEPVWRFPLKIKNYNDLCIENCHVPRILVVVSVPADSAEWVESTFESSVLQHGARWLSLKGRPASDHASTVTVDIDAESIFHVASVRSLFRMVGEEQL